MVLASLALSASPCSGARDEVPSRVIGWSVEDASWLERELAEWMRARDRRWCEGDGGLQVSASELEASVSYGPNQRSLSRAGQPAELFRYQVAAATEELVRSTWEAPPPARGSLFVRGEGALVVADLAGGGSIGGAFLPVPSLRLELSVGGSGLINRALDDQTTLSAQLIRGGFDVSWLPLQVGVFRAGPRGSVQGGAWLVQAGDATATAPWLFLGGGLTAGVEMKHLDVLLFGEVGSSLLGARIEREGVPVATTRGLTVLFGLQLGWLIN